MSMLPIFGGESWGYTRPSRIPDQHFGMGLDTLDFLTPLLQPFNATTIYRSPSHPRYYRPWRAAANRSDVGSTIAASKDKFQVTLDVQQFAPEEITVKVTGKNTITIEGKHEEKQDEHGFVSRHFVRRYILPDGHDINNVVSNLSSDGVLSVTAPRIAESIEEHRSVPIQQTGVPLKTVAKPKGEEPKKDE